MGPGYSPEPQRFREEGLLARHPWWGQKLAERKDAVQCVRAAEGYRGRDVRPRSFAQTGNCVAVGPGRIGLSGRLPEPFQSSLSQ